MGYVLLCEAFFKTIIVRNSDICDMEKFLLNHHPSHSFQIQYRLILNYEAVIKNLELVGYCYCLRDALPLVGVMTNYTSFFGYIFKITLVTPLVSPCIYRRTRGASIDNLLSPLVQPSELSIAEHS